MSLGMARWLRCCCAALLPVLASGCQPWQTGGVTELRTAVKIIHDAGGTETPRIVDLPDILSQESSNVISASYRVTFRSPSSLRPQAMLIPEFGNFVRVRLNGREIAQFDRPPSVLNGLFLSPLVLYLPEALLYDDNLLEMQIVGHPNAGLARLLVGPSHQVEKLFGIYWSLSTGLLMVMVTAGAFFTLLALLLWWGTRIPVYLALAASAVTLVLYTAMLLAWQETPIGWGKASALLLAYHMHLALVGFCALHVLGMERRRLWALAGTYWLSLAAAVTISAMYGSTHPYMIARLLTLVFVAAAVVHIVRAGTKRSSLTFWTMVVIAMGGIGYILRDVMGSFTGRPSYGELPLHRLLAPGFMATVMMFVVEQYTDTLRSLRTVNATLEQRIQGAQAELRAAFESLRAAERAAAAEQERRRLMRDIHDGLGSQLISSLSLAEQPDTTRNEIIEAIESCITELRVAVDSLEPFEDDLLAALGTLRIRVEPMLARANVQLQWRVREVAVGRNWSASDIGHLLRVLLEAFANVVRHSGATRVVLCCAASRRHAAFWVSVYDNGAGLTQNNPKRLPGRGLANIRERAQMIGAQLSIRSRPRGTRLRLVWPLSPTQVR